MPSTTVHYITPSEDSTERTNTDGKKPTNIQIFYLRATIVILTLTLTTVSAILVWRIIADSRDCRSEEQSTQPLNEQRNYKCPSVGNTNYLPHVLPYQARRALKGVKERLKDEIEKKRLVSVSFIAAYRDKTVWNAAYGVLDKSSILENTPDVDTLYRTGSLVKLLTVLMTFKLLREKKLDTLDDSLHKYFPGFSVKNPFSADPITIRQILSHTSGLPREVPCGPSFSSSHGNICPVNMTFVLKQLQNTQLKFAPGTLVGYSNLGYAILAHILFERFGGRNRNWQEWVQHELLYALDMTRTVLNNGRFHRHNLALSYKANSMLSPVINWGWSAPSFQMLTSASDLTKLMLAILNPGTRSFIDESMIRGMFKPEFVFPDLYTIFSSGWQIRYHNSIRVVTKAGAVPGSSAAMILMPEQKFGFVILATGQEIAPRLAEEVSVKLSKTFSTSLISKHRKIRPAPDSRRYIGLYTLKNNWSDKVKATISIESNTGYLMLSQEPGYPPYVYLSFITSQLSQIVYPAGLSCQVYALGQDKENVKFRDYDSEGRFEEFTLGSFVFQRTGD